MTLNYFNENCPLSCFECHIKCFTANQSGPTYPSKDRTLAIKRRKNKALEKKRANKTMALVESKFNKAHTKWLEGFITYEEFLATVKKRANIQKKAIRNNQITIQITFPTTDIVKIKTGNSISHLIQFLYYVRRSTKSPAIDIACEQAISKLEFAEFCDADIVSTFMEKNVLNVTIGFYNKVNLSKFKKHCIS